MREIFPTHHTAYSKSAGKVVGFIALLGIAGTAMAAPALARQAQLAAAYSHLPLSFEANRGQAPPGSLSCPRPWLWSVFND